MLKQALALLAGALVCAVLAYVALTQGAQAPSGPPAQAPDSSTPSVSSTPSASSPTGEDAGGLPMAVPGDVGRTEAVPSDRPIAAAPAPIPLPSTTSSTSIPRTIAVPAPGPAGLVIPVSGITSAQLADTFGDPRSSERMHEALDIMAPTGTPVLAVAAGSIEKLFDSDRGGLTIYQFEPGGRYAYYYAHLQRYAPGLAEGQAVRQGQVIGYVGSTGNADPAAPHLHFAIFLLGPERQWWRGTPINPYPLLGGR